jgi:hypothetical protein
MLFISDHPIVDHFPIPAEIIGDFPRDAAIPACWIQDPAACHPRAFYFNLPLLFIK